MQDKRAIIVGGGPAGLTAACEMLKRTNVKPLVLEQSDLFGGISRTVNYKGNRMDIGGHRFFSKNQYIMNWWEEVMGMQGEPALDDLLLDRKMHDLVEGGKDPQKVDRVMLVRERISRILYLRRMFDYPITVKYQTFANMGLVNTMRAGFGFLRASVHKKEENSLENFYINRFGEPLYSMFFEDYTEKVWGVHPSKLAADWGVQRVKGLSIATIVKDIVMKPFRSSGLDQQSVETSLIEKFIYPKLGPGQLWECVAEEVSTMGGETELNSRVVGVNVESGRVVSVDVERDGVVERESCDYMMSTMAIKDLVSVIKGIDVPKDVMRISQELPYRDFITVGLLVTGLKINNSTKVKSFKNRVPDTWIYIQEPDVKLGRLQVFNNWSPYMVADYENTMFIGLEYFCTEGDSLWSMTEQEFIDMAVSEVEKIGIVNRADILDSTQIKVKKAYPSYFGSYHELDRVKEFLDKIENLYCIGRNGQHRYNNMDHSMLTAIEAVENIRSGKVCKDNVWNINTEDEYHETKK